MKNYFKLAICSILTTSALFLTACGSDNNDEPDNGATEETTETGQTIKINNTSWFLNNQSSYTVYSSLYYNSTNLYVRATEQITTDYPLFWFQGIIDKSLSPENLTIGEELEFNSISGYYLINSATYYTLESIISGNITYAGYDNAKNTLALKFNNTTFIYNSTNKIVVNGTIKIKYVLSEI